MVLLPAGGTIDLILKWWYYTKGWYCTRWYYTRGWYYRPDIEGVVLHQVVLYQGVET